MDGFHTIIWRPMSINWHIQKKEKSLTCRLLSDFKITISNYLLILLQGSSVDFGHASIYDPIPKATTKNSTTNSNKCFTFIYSVITLCLYICLYMSLCLYLIIFRESLDRPSVCLPALSLEKREMNRKYRNTYY